MEEEAEKRGGALAGAAARENARLSDRAAKSLCVPFDRWNAQGLPATGCPSERAFMDVSRIRKGQSARACAAPLNFVWWIGSARKTLCRGLGSRWFPERFHRNSLVTHFQHGQVCSAVWCLENYAIARCRLHQRAAQRRHPTDVVAVEIHLVGAHDAHHSLRSRGIGIAHSGSDECLRRRLYRSRSFRVNHFRGLDSLREKANPPIDLAQPPLAVLIVGVFTAITVARSPRHHPRHGPASNFFPKSGDMFTAMC